MRDRRVLGLGLLMTVSSAVIAQQVPPAAFAQKVALNIPAQPVADAIGELGQQSGLTIVIESQLGRDVKAPALVGLYTTEEALRRILPNQLHTEYLDSKTVAVMSGTAPTTQSRMRMASASGAADVLASATDGGSSGEEESNVAPSHASTADETLKKRLEEIVVTGTHIRGDQPSSPLIVIDRAEIDRSGYTTLGGLMQSLPQNFSGGVNPQVTVGNAPGNDGDINPAGSSAPDLRGLGPSSTLTLDRPTYHPAGP